MNLAMRLPTLLAITALLGLTSIPALGVTSAQTAMNKLPKTPSPAKKSLDQIKLHTYQAKDLSGSFIGVPAHLIDVQDYTLDWVSPDPKQVPAFPEPLPEKIKSKIQLFYNSGKYNGSAGWMVVPRKWVLVNADIGSDGTFFEFTSPNGTSSGWMMISMSHCPRSDCVLNDLAGLLPGAKSALTWAYQHRNFPETIPPNAKLVPKPISISHPNPCSALFKYTRNGTLIHGAVLLDGTSGDLADATLYITSVGTTKNVAGYIASSFIKYQVHRSFYQSCQTRHTSQG